MAYPSSKQEKDTSTIKKKKRKTKLSTSSTQLLQCKKCSAFFHLTRYMRHSTQCQGVTSQASASLVDSTSETASPTINPTDSLMEDVLNNKNCHDASNLDDNPSPEIKSHNVVAMLEDTINDDDSQSVNSLIDGSTTSNHELESHEDEEDPFEEIYQRIQRIQLQETTAATIDDNFIVDADGSIDPPSDGQPNKQPITSPCVLPSDSNTVATDQGDGISIYSEPSNNASSGTHSFEQFQMSIEEEITKIDSLTIHDKSMLSLIVHCNRTKAPKGFFDAFMAMLKKEVKENGFKISKAQTRDTFISHLRKDFPCAIPSFVYIPTSLEKEKVCHSLPIKMNPSNFVKVMKFSFLDQLNDLLNDFSIFGDLDKLCVNEDIDQRFMPFVAGEDDLFNEVLGGDWYKRTSPQLRNKLRDFLLPLIFYADKTGTDVNQRYSLEPWLFTLGLFRRSVRENQDAWRYLCFIPDMHTMATKGMSPEGKMQLYHLCLHEILKEII
jgi:hypothetical protein